MVKEIPLQNGMVALVDDEDYERVSQHVWYVKYYKTAIRVVSNTKEGSPVVLARFILGLGKEDTRKFATFLDNNQLNNQKQNLKIEDTKYGVVTKSKSHMGSTSRYKGVYFHKLMNKWSAEIKAKGKKLYLGCYEDEDEAARIYNLKAREIHGACAFQNIIGEDNRNVKTENIKINQLRRKNRTGFRGIYQRNVKRNGEARKKVRFQAQITLGGRKQHLGTFDTAEEAAKAYDQKAYELHGDKAILNFPENVGEYHEKS